MLEITVSRATHLKKMGRGPLKALIIFKLLEKSYAVLTQLHVFHFLVLLPLHSLWCTRPLQLIEIG